MTGPKTADPRIHLIVDMLYDFIDGTMACTGADSAVSCSAAYAEAHPDQRIWYLCDAHPADHSSFLPQGGPWPAHCVAGTRGAAIHEAFNRLSEAGNRPDPARNIFRKGTDAGTEQYSGFEAADSLGRRPSELLLPGEPVLVSGIATEYCIRATVLDLLRDGHPVLLLTGGLACVSPEGHAATLKELERAGVRLL